MERSQQEMFMLIMIIAMYFQNHKLRVNIRIMLPTQSVVTLAPHHQEVREGVNFVSFTNQNINLPS